MVFLGLLSAAAGATIPSLTESEFQQQNLTAGDVDLSQVTPSFLSGFFVAVGIMLTGIGIVSFVNAYGLLNRKSWAWKLTIILAIITMIVSIIWIFAAPPSSGSAMLTIINLIISGIILYYVYRPHVKAYFGKMVRSSGRPSEIR
jgi:uncharacterized membrane protein YfcA